MLQRIGTDDIMDLRYDVFFPTGVGYYVERKLQGWITGRTIIMYSIPRGSMCVRITAPG